MTVTQIMPQIKEYQMVSKTLIVSVDTNDLRDIIKMAYEAGKNNADNPDAMCHVEAITEMMGIIEGLVK